jgi:hypothetical protein
MRRQLHADWAAMVLWKRAMDPDWSPPIPSNSPRVVVSAVAWEILDRARPAPRANSTSGSRAAATRFFRKLFKGLEYVPRVVVTDKLGSYQAARRRVARSVEHRQSKYLNNRAGNSHQPTRQRERAMKRFISPGHAQRFLSAFSGISPHFRPRRHCSTPRNTAARWPTASVPGGLFTGVFCLIDYRRRGE